MRIAAILTCYNRKDKTIKCLESLFQIYPEFDVFLTDDGSTDGTSDAVKKLFPSVKIIKGDGKLFWSRGMYLAWKNAICYDYDFYLWLNDDIELLSFFLDELFRSYRLAGEECIVSGLIGDITQPSLVLYGGSNMEKKLILERETPQDIKFMNGNVVLIPRSVVNKIGIIDPVLHHDLGDVDYGLTAQEHGIKVVSTTRIIALGSSNNYCRIRKWNTTLVRRLKKLYSPLGSNPNLNFYFRRKHFGLLNASIYWCFLHFINMIPDKIVTIIWKDKYCDT